MYILYVYFKHTITKVEEICVLFREGTVRVIGELCPCLRCHGFWGSKRNASHTEPQSVKHGTQLTHHGWKTHHDQHGAGRSQNKLLTKVSLCSDMGHATTVRWVGWSRMSSKVIQHAGKLRLPQYLCEGFHQSTETCTWANPKSVPALLQPKRVTNLFLLGLHMIKYLQIWIRLVPKCT